MGKQSSNDWLTAMPKCGGVGSCRKMVLAFASRWGLLLFFCTLKYTLVFIVSSAKKN
jgi:hypothetical protein